MQSAAEIDRKAEQALRAVERAFGVHIALHDLRGTICHPDGKVTQPRRHIHRHPCCLLGRDSQPGWDDRCFKHCFTESEKEAANTGRPFCKSCWKGLVELVVPLIHGSHHQLTIYAGAFRKPGAETEPGFPSDPAYLKLFEELPERPGQRRLAELGSLLTLFGHGLLHSISQSDAGEDLSRGSAIRRFIEGNAHRQTGIGELARHLHLSPSRASHAVREFTGMSFQDLLLKERMTRAAKLLEQSHEPLGEIASKLGFKTEFYFNRVFSGHYGVPPGKFRRDRQEAGDPVRRRYVERRLQKALTELNCKPVSRRRGRKAD